MKSVHEMRLILHWLARVSAVLLLALLFAFLVGERFSDGGFLVFLEKDLLNKALFASHLVTVFGLLILWWRELTGGIVVLVGLIAFYLLNYCASGQFPSGAFPLFFLPGLAAIAAYAFKKIEAKRK